MEKMAELFDNNLFTAFDSNVSLGILLFLIIAYLLGVFTGLLLRGRKVRLLRKELKAKEKEAKEFQIKIDELNESIVQKDASLEKVMIEREELLARLQGAEADKRQLQNDLNSALQQYDQLQISYQAQEETIADLSNRTSAATTSYAETSAVTASSDDNSGDIGELQNLYAQTRSRLERLEEKINHLESENNSLQESLQTISKKTELAPEQFDQHVVLTQPKNAEVIGGRIVVDDNMEKDDLTLINGVGPFLEKKLNEVGVYTYAQVSAWSTDEVSQITRDIGFFPGRIEQDNWVGQAARLQQMKADNPNAFTKQDEHPNNPKDLKIIAGVGPKTEELLKSNGVRNWVELASTDVERLRAVLRDAGAPYDSLDPSTWPEQARLASNGEWERFEDYQGYLGVD
ncbi:MAG: helix-hairpin-helix domain-containing protein [Bacteroidota bacterium]